MVKMMNLSYNSKSSMAKKPTKAGEPPVISKHTDACAFHSDRTRCTCGLLAEGGKTGRPTKLTIEVQAVIVDSIRSGSTKVDAAAAAGIHRDTFNSWLKSGEAKDADPLFSDFSAAIKKAEAECANECAATVMKASRKTWQAAAWWLERRRRDDYALRREITGADGEQFIPDHLSEANKRAAKFALKKAAKAAVAA